MSAHDRRPGPDEAGRFGDFGGRFMPEALMAALDELTAAWQRGDGRRGVHRPSSTACSTSTPECRACSTTRPSSASVAGARILLKREDLNHTGAHKIRNVLGQALLTRRMGKTRMIAETGAGQHGVATATAAAYLGLECTVYMGEVDTERQALNVARMQLLGAEVIPVTSGSRTLKDAINEAIRDWVASVDHTAYCFGTAAGPHPFPAMVRDFCRGIGDEARAQCLELTGALPDAIVACVGGGSNAIGLFTAFLDDAVGRASTASRPAATASTPSATRRRSGPARSACSTAPAPTCSRTRTARPSSPTRSPPGSTTPASARSTPTSPQTGRATYRPVTDAAAMDALALLARTEGIIPAIESAHAVAGALELAKERPGQDDPGQPVRPRRQGHGHRHRVVRARPGRRRRDARARHRGADRRGREVTSAARVPTRVREDPRRGPGRAGRLPPGRLPRRAPVAIEALEVMVDSGCDVIEVGPALQRPGDGRTHHPGRRPAGPRRAASAPRDVLRTVEAVAATGTPDRGDDLLEPRRALRRRAVRAPTSRTPGERA